MNTHPIPDNHNSLMPYLILHDADGFKAFAEECLGAESLHLSHREDGKVMHGELRIGRQTIMYAEATADWPASTSGMFIYVDDPDEVYRKMLALGSTSLMPPRDMDYGRSGGAQDPYGNTWWMTRSPLA